MTAKVTQACTGGGGLNCFCFFFLMQGKLCSASQQRRDPKGRIFLSARNRFSLNVASLQQTGGGGGLPIVIT